MPDGSRLTMSDMQIDYFGAARAALPPCWRAAVGDEFEVPYMQRLGAFLVAERAAGKSVFPDDARTFAALCRTPLNQVKAVILGQDPYHRPGQAMGLSFAVPVGVKLPPSLRNIYQELAADIGATTPEHGDLTAWTDRGVLLLNASLSVEEGKAGSHAKVGWQRFTDAVLAAVNARQEPVAFVLWGNDARKKAAMLNGVKHLVHQSEHPSPLSAYRGFFGSRPFSRVNAFLAARGIGPIDWRLAI
jgi:uracil-DNA glycosylase